MSSEAPKALKVAELMKSTLGSRGTVNALLAVILIARIIIIVTGTTIIAMGDGHANVGRAAMTAIMRMAAAIRPHRIPTTVLPPMFQWRAANG